MNVVKKPEERFLTPKIIYSLYIYKSEEDAEKKQDAENELKQDKMSMRRWEEKGIEGAGEGTGEESQKEKFEKE